MKENPIRSLPGIPVLLALLAVALFGAWLIVTGAGGVRIGGIALVAGAAFLLLGAYMVEPNQAAVVSLFGKYVGTVKDNGLRWNNPFYAIKKVSMRADLAESSCTNASPTMPLSPNISASEKSATHQFSPR